MAAYGVRNGYARRHGAHDSALDVPSKDEVARLRMRELEEENSLLLEKATSSTERFIDYENHIRVLQEQVKSQEQRLNANRTPEPLPEQASLSRLGTFMRKGSLAPPSGNMASPSAREQELELALIKEQKARAEAEARAQQVNVEVEELSATLFQEANDMVANERRENAALRAQIKELQGAGGPVAEVLSNENERLKQKLQILEQRDAERNKRLERLEAAQRRIDRVRTMLLPR
ncbi:uncharacterized protein RCC_09342 [Ramularia collo-cygni]|uniref:GDP/GTP exchange factor Sec2 N-terminal domain-containing protein n=1 Tax=Ramularia collo-cygni TaxID=112498 RepID=A0A2D3VP41_9PEZI|nr:uncharacterized protein RCC_09342 [Ramularia collo-cygni]CZT23628.1 uncharacterized protein RCC_09342 [Ramularia collo-cygni]